MLMIKPHSEWAGRVCNMIADAVYAACEEFNRSAVEFAARAHTIDRNKYVVQFSLFSLYNEPVA